MSAVSGPKLPLQLSGVFEFIKCGALLQALVQFASRFRLAPGLDKRNRKVVADFGVRGIAQSGIAQEARPAIHLTLPDQYPTERVQNGGIAVRQLIGPLGVFQCRLVALPIRDLGEVVKNFDIIRIALQ